MSSTAVTHAYRTLYRNGLRAIQFAKPARYTLRDRLRWAFRRGSATDLDPHKIQQTTEFLQCATKTRGLEHKILKNLLYVWWHQSQRGRGRVRLRGGTRSQAEIRVTAYDTFNHNIRMLNESMGMCLPCTTIRDP